MSVGDLRIVVLTSRPPRPGSVTTAAVTVLDTWGVQVQVVEPARIGAHARAALPPTACVSIRSMSRPAVIVDAAAAHLVLLRSIDDHVLETAQAVEAAGGRCLNETRVVRLTRDRDRLATLLDSHGVPTLADTHSRWLHRTVDGRNVCKIYRIGSQVFGARRRHGTTTPMTVPAEVCELTDNVADALGTRLFGLDVALDVPVAGQEHGGALVLDVHPFPGFKGVPDAALRVADYIYARALEAQAVASPPSMHTATAREEAR